MIYGEITEDARFRFISAAHSGARGFSPGCTTGSWK